ncbi:MAG: response regulator transcription factor [Bacteroidetes bacterium]|nr:MAG: response regulator transcription factor [Bacteroidota bacterium]TNF00757.1 MAG: response regulator transcription factor [Bacteroidota bacterium]
MAQQVLLVEDEESIAEMVALNLGLEGYEVEVITTGTEAAEVIASNRDFDLFILDVMLPGVNGVDLCRMIRKKSDTPVLFLSAKGTTTDRIEGLKAGGNDYLPKPFDLEELLLRVNVLTQGIKAEEEELSIGNATVNMKTFEGTDKDGNQISLSKKEVDLLRLFAQHEGEVVSRAEILDKVWGQDQYPTTRTIDNFILHFRKLFEENPRDPRYFHSIRGVGYKFTK